MRHNLSVAQLIKAQSLQVHNIAYVEAEDPVISAVVLKTEVRARLNFEFFLKLKFVHLLKRLERDLQMLLLSHTILEVVPALLKRQLRYPVELSLDADQFMHKCIILFHLLVEYLHLLWQVVAAASIARH